MAIEIVDLHYEKYTHYFKVIASLSPWHLAIHYGLDLRKLTDV